MRIAGKAIAVLILSCAVGFGAKLRQVAMVDLPGNPGFSQIAVANGQIVISRPGTNTIEIFSPVKRRVIARISRVSDPRGIAVDDEAGRVFIALAGTNTIAVADSRTWQVQQMIPVKSRPEKLLWVPEAHSLYVSSVLGRNISIVDPKLGQETSEIALEALPQDMIFDAERQLLLVTLQDQNAVAGIDASRRIVQRFKLAASEPTGMALDASRRKLYVAVRYAVLALSADTGAELARIPAPGATNALILDPNANLLYAAAGDGAVLAINTSSNTVDHELPTDVKGYNIAYDPEHKMLFLPGGREGRSKMVILSPISMTDQNRPQTAETPSNAPQTAMRK